MNLKLNEFKALYEALETGTVWIDHLLLGFLLYLERKFIDLRVKNEVDEAIKEYQTLHQQDVPDMVTPVYSERPVATSESLPEMRLTAPWYIDKVSERSEPPESL